MQAKYSKKRTAGFVTIKQQLPKTKLQMVYIYSFAENTLISM